ncbi:MAG: nicotinamide-nucleotide adenylyltransferase [Asgard group archaeon]|nr:nicotinamide-nucleotide adenylyltransferase [Asgard group archaeon]
MRGLLVGRFQPFHKGHLSIVKHILQEMDEIIIIIAAAHKSHYQKNPFTAGERIEMIRQTMKKELKNPQNVLIIPASNVNDNDLWIYHLKRLSPSFDIVYTNNPLTTTLFKNAGYKVRETPYFHREKYSGSIIRKFMAENNKKWESLVPLSVKKFLLEINAVTRMRNILANDKNHSKK